MELLVDKVVMYESSALNKSLTCQMSPPVIFLPSAGVWCKFSLAVCHSRARYTWAAPPGLWGRPWSLSRVPPAGSGAVALAMQAVCCSQSWLQSTAKAARGFQLGVCKIFAVISFALSIIGKIMEADLAQSMSKVKRLQTDFQVNELRRRHHPGMQIM